MSKALNIAMLAACPYPTAQGTQALIGELARGLSQGGHNIHLVTYGHGSAKTPQSFAIHRTPNIPGYRRLRSGPDFAKPILDALMVRTALRVVREQKCQIIHAHNYEAALVGWLVSRLTGVPLVYHAHNWMEDELPGYFQHKALAEIARILGMALDRFVPARAHKVIALHGLMAKKLESFGVEAQKIHVIEPGIDLELWSEVEPVQTGDRVIYAGNLDSYQNLDLAFKAMAIVTREIRTARLIIATPNDPELAWKMLRGHGAAEWCELIHCADAKATAQQYSRAKLALCPRTSPSGFPVKILNAMAAGVPVVACRSGAWGLKPGISGQTVNDDDPESMARAIVQLLINGSHRSMLAEAARVSVKARYSRTRMCEEVEKIWLSVLRG